MHHHHLAGRASAIGSNACTTCSKTQPHAREHFDNQTGRACRVHPGSAYARCCHARCWYRPLCKQSTAKNTNTRSEACACQAPVDKWNERNTPAARFC